MKPLLECYVKKHFTKLLECVSALYFSLLPHPGKPDCYKKGKEKKNVTLIKPMFQFINPENVRKLEVF